MKDQQTVEQFIGLRARGISFAKIAQQLVQTENHANFGQFRTDSAIHDQPSPANSLWQRVLAPDLRPQILAFPISAFPRSINHQPKLLHSCLRIAS